MCAVVVVIVQRRRIKPYPELSLVYALAGVLVGVAGAGGAPLLPPVAEGTGGKSASPDSTCCCKLSMLSCLPGYHSDSVYTLNITCQ